MWYHLILSDITYNQDDITLKLDDIILMRGDITLNRGDITSKARWYHILLINSKTAPHTSPFALDSWGSWYKASYNTKNTNWNVRS